MYYKMYIKNIHSGKNIAIGDKKKLFITLSSPFFFIPVRYFSFFKPKEQRKSF